jgi:hypothetical protein
MPPGAWIHLEREGEGVTPAPAPGELRDIPPLIGEERDVSRTRETKKQQIGDVRIPSHRSRQE